MKLPKLSYTPYVRRFLLVNLFAGLSSVAIFAGWSYWATRNLPSFDSIDDFDPPQVTRVYDRNGVLVGELFRQRRTVVPLEDIPDTVKNAFIAAEDDRFYAHPGIDVTGIARAMVKNLLAGHTKQGASTITQQLVKTLLLTPERSYRRKIREATLAMRLEETLSKDEILWIYLNQIYFGHGRYGVEEASRFYFDKPVKDVTLGEAALLAGLPKAPAYYSPRRYPARATARRGYVLGRMVELGMVDASEAAVAESSGLELPELPEDPPGAWYLEAARRELAERLGDDLVLEGGLSVHLAMDAELQSAAERHLRATLERTDRRHGWRGALAHLDPAGMDAVRERFEEKVKKIRARVGPEAALLWDLAEVAEAPAERTDPPAVELVRGERAEVLVALVSAVDPKTDVAHLDLGGASVEVDLKSVRWARPYDPETGSDRPLAISDVLAVGDLVHCRIEPLLGEQLDAIGRDEHPVVAGHLSQRPGVEGALVSIDPQTREVVALVGGYDGKNDRFNRALQARRQPGSGFKPFVYGAALDSGRFRSTSRLLDAPEVFHDPYTGQVWKPENAGGRFSGELSMADALARSVNLVAVRLIDSVGVDSVIDFARRAGVKGKLPRVLALALGSAEVTPVDLVNAYATIASLGTYDDPVLVRRVETKDGRVLFEHTPHPKARIRPAVAYVLADLMTGVVERGTARRLNKLGRPVAGKTGTTNDQRDAWFVGFTPDLVTGVWVGFDNPRTLGKGAYGARIAGPAWLGYMQEALASRPVRWFDPPEGVVFVRVDTKTDRLASPKGPGEYQAYVAGTEPLRVAPEAAAALSAQDYGQFFGDEL